MVRRAFFFCTRGSVFASWNSEKFPSFHNKMARDIDLCSCYFRKYKRTTCNPLMYRVLKKVILTLFDALNESKSSKKFMSIRNFRIGPGKGYLSNSGISKENYQKKIRKKSQICLYSDFTIDPLLRVLDLQKWHFWNRSCVLNIPKKHTSAMRL